MIGSALYGFKKYNPVSYGQLMLSALGLCIISNKINENESYQVLTGKVIPLDPLIRTVYNFMKVRMNVHNPQFQWKDLWKDRKNDFDLECTKMQTGNCATMARACRKHFYSELKKDHPSIEVECMAIIGGDHRFLVIGLNPSKLDTSKNDIICDPWTNAYYPAQLKNNLYDFIGVLPMNNRFETCVTPLNPDKTLMFTNK